MNKGLFSYHTNQYESGEIRYGVNPPNNDTANWVKCDGSSLTKKSPLYKKFLKNFDASTASWPSVTGNGSYDIWAVAWGNGLWVITGQNGTVRTSPNANLTTWTTRSWTVGGYTLRDLIYANNLFVGVGDNGYTAISTDGLTWTSGSLGSADIGYAITYGNGLWVAGGANGLIRTSTDAVTWTNRTANFGTSTIYALKYSNNLFLAGGAGGTLRTSTDAITWTTQTPNFGTNIIYDFAYGAGVHVAVGEVGKINYSTDGVTWVTGNNSSGQTTAKRGVAFGSGVFVAAGFSQNVASSTDGITWTSSSTLNALNGVDFLCAFYSPEYELFTVAGVSAIQYKMLVNVTLPTITLNNKIFGWLKK